MQRWSRFGLAAVAAISLFAPLHASQAQAQRAGAERAQQHMNQTGYAIWTGVVGPDPKQSQ